MLIITAEIDARLSKLMSQEAFGPPPECLDEREPKSILIGKATREQQAIALLYGEVTAEHEQLHTADGLPFGINPHVSFEHYRNHVMQPALFEMLKWSVHRAYPEQKTNLAIRFDSDWNMYAMPKRGKRKYRVVLAAALLFYVLISAIYGNGKYFGWW